MSKVTIVTGNNTKNFNAYGYKTLASYYKYLDKDIDLVVYSEEPVKLKHGENRLMSSVQGLVDFQERHKNNEEAKGLKVRRGWKTKEVVTGYCYRYDMVKFSKQVYYLYDAAVRLSRNSQYLIWLDNDVLFTGKVTKEFLTGLIPDQKMCAYLGRGNKHSEIGFLIFKVPHALNLIAEYAAPLSDDSVFNLPEWHSAYLFDEARKNSEVPCYNLTPNGRGNVFQQSVLDRCMVHMKGKRKSRI